MKSRAVLAVLTLFLLISPAFARDWFVRAGSADGDGTIAKPFMDPWKALEKYEAGDRINIAEGKYYGKLDCGTWKIPLKAELLGGFFRARPLEEFHRTTLEKGHKESLGYVPRAG
jgi:hypothetical protein